MGTYGSNLVNDDNDTAEHSRYPLKHLHRRHGGGGTGKNKMRAITGADDSRSVDYRVIILSGIFFFPVVGQPFRFLVLFLSFLWGSRA